MSDDAGEEDPPVPVGQPLELNVIEGTQILSIEPGENQLKALSASQRHELATRKQRHDQTEERKRNDREHAFRIIGFIVLIVILLGALVWGSWAAVYGDTPEIRSWGQSITLTLLGAVGGGIAGFFAGKVTK